MMWAGTLPCPDQHIIKEMLDASRRRIPSGAGFGALIIAYTNGDRIILPPRACVDAVGLGIKCPKRHIHAVQAFISAGKGFELIRRKKQPGKPFGAQIPRLILRNSKGNSPSGTNCLTWLGSRTREVPQKGQCDVSPAAKVKVAAREVHCTALTSSCSCLASNLASVAADYFPQFSRLRSKSNRFSCPQ